MLNVLGTEHTASIPTLSSASSSISAMAEATGAAEFEALVDDPASVDLAVSSCARS